MSGDADPELFGVDTAEVDFLLVAAVAVVAVAVVELLQRLVEVQLDCSRIQQQPSTATAIDLAKGPN